MTSPSDDAAASNDAALPSSWNNGLLASAYVPLTDVAAPIGASLLSALERARIAAYLSETAEDDGALRLYVASGERADARTIVAAVVRATGTDSPDGAPLPAPAITPAATAAQAVTWTDPLAGIDADAAFAALIADWHVDTHNAIRAAEKDLSREDENWRLRLNQPAAEPEELAWLDDDHYVPPNPPPVPRPTAAVALGLLLVLASIFLIGFGGLLGLPFQLSLFLGVCGIVTTTVMFVLRLREYRDDDDDGAVL